MKKDFFWSLVIEPTWVQASVWTLEDKSARVYAVGSATHWEADSNLIDAADTALSSAISILPEEALEPSKTVFGVSPSWVEGGEIKKEHLDRISEICSKLSLEPVGFVVLSEAIAHYYKNKEGSPLSAVVVGINESNLDISLFKLGVFAGNFVVARSVSIADDIAEGLARFGTKETLPSRFLLYDGRQGELEDARQTISAANWESFRDKVNLLHTPKVEIVDPKSKVVAVSLAGAAEMGEATSVSVEEEEGKEQTANEMGFVVNQDVGEVQSRNDQEVAAQFPSEPKAPRIKFGNITNNFRSVFSLFSIFPRKRMFISGLVVLLVALVAGFVAWWFLPKATVVIYVAPQKLEESQVVSIDTSANSANYDKNMIPGSTVSVTASGDKTTSTTGSKKVGEKAKGTVTIRNGTAASVQLSAGTSLIGPNDLEFTTDSAASVSAAVSPSSPGTKEIDVTASDVGAEYNLAKDETLKVGNYPKSDVDAIAAGDFSGGSSREIATVTEEDRTKLEEELLDELTSEAVEELKNKVSADQILVDDALQAESSATDFSNKVGDETSTLKLAMEAEVVGLVVNKPSLAQLVKHYLEGKVPQGFVLREEQIIYEFSFEDVEDDVWQVEVSIVANLLPEVAIEDIVKNIAGKYPKIAQEYLQRSLPGFVRAEIKAKPKLPGRLGTLPRMVKNIDIEISADR